MKDFESELGYSFKDKDLLRTSFTHSSYAYENSVESNERLEFLGDAVLEMNISLYLYRRFPNMHEGGLTKMRAAVVCEPSLARAARKLGIGRMLRLGKGEDATGGRERESLLSDALEAIIGAVFLDGGHASANALVERLLAGYIEELVSGRSVSDYKTALQEVLQRDSQDAISYSIVSESGPAHSKEFIAEISHRGKVLGRGQGRSKKEAEQCAARLALRTLRP